MVENGFKKMKMKEDSYGASLRPTARGIAWKIVHIPGGSCDSAHKT